MKNTIFETIIELRAVLAKMDIPIYKEVRPTSADGKSIVLTYVPIKKNNICSINDVIILLYLPKISGLVDSGSISNYCTQISTIISEFSAKNGMINMNNLLEPYTDNTETGLTVTTQKIRTINY
jgi:hypothetical protein